MIISINSYTQRRFHRTQKEAGIDEKEWENRMKPLMSWVELVVRAIVIGIVVGGVVLILMGMAGK